MFKSMKVLLCCDLSWECVVCMWEVLSSLSHSLSKWYFLYYAPEARCRKQHSTPKAWKQWVGTPLKPCGCIRLSKLKLMSLLNALNWCFLSSCVFVPRGFLVGYICVDPEQDSCEFRFATQHTTAVILVIQCLHLHKWTKNPMVPVYSICRQTT